MGSIFAFDLRSLALARILAGLIVLGDLLNRSFHLQAHYTRTGVLPQQAYFRHLEPTAFPSLYLLNDMTWFVGLLYLVHGIVAAAVMLGFQTRWSTALCWYLTVSLHFRNTLVNNGGDILLRLLLLWAIFLPWGEVWSLDSLVSTGRSKSKLDSRPACAFFGLQMVVLYLFAGLSKMRYAIWTEEGTALYYTLSVDHIATEYAVYLYRSPELMMILTRLVVWVEIGGALLLLVRWWPVRLSVVLGFVALHFSFGLFLELGTFRYVPLIGLAAFLPGKIWDVFSPPKLPRKWRLRLVSALRKVPRRPQSVWKGKAVTALLSACFVFGLLSSVEDLTNQSLMPDWARQAGHSAGIHQRWPLFTLLDKVKDGWYVFHATLADGSEVDLLHGREVDWHRPKLISATYDGQRWRRFMTNVMLRPSQGLLPWYSQYSRQRWNKEHPDNQVQRLVIHFMNEPQHPDYRYTPPQKWTLDVWQKSENEGV